MPVRRYRSVEEMEDAAWMDPSDPQLWPTIREVWRLAERMSPRRFPRGVYKNRSIEEANERAEAWERDSDVAPAAPGSRQGP